MVTFIDEPDVPEKRRVIRYLDDDEEAGQSDLPRPQRRASVASSMTSVYSTDRARRRSIDPALAIPIEYRTLYAAISLNIQEAILISLGPFTLVTRRRRSWLKPERRRTRLLLVSGIYYHTWSTLADINQILPSWIGIPLRRRHFSADSIPRLLRVSLLVRSRMPRASMAPIARLLLLRSAGARYSDTSLEALVHCF